MTSDCSLERLSLGVFADWSPPSPEAIGFAADSAGMKDIVLGVYSKHPTKFKPRGWSMAKLQEIVEACAETGLVPHLMIWAVRDKNRLPASLDWCRAAMEKIPQLRSVLLDCEGQWHKGKGIGPNAAAHMTAEKLKGYRWGVTGLTKLHRTVRPVAMAASYVLPQCYSFWKPGGKHWSHSRSSFPMTIQATGVESWKEAESEIIMGLGCYWANRPASGLTPALSASQTMSACAIETVALEVYSAWYWSLKWMRARSAHGREVRQFFGAR